MMNRRIRLGMVGGGAGAFIGDVHRMAARLDDHYTLIAGNLSSNPGLALMRARAPGSMTTPRHKAGKHRRGVRRSGALRR